VEGEKPTQIGIGKANFAADAMEIKKGDFKLFWIFFIKLHEISSEYSP
jgi:hypothetical protein